MDELKPCPFCGSKEIDYGLMTGVMHGWTYVQCEECLAEIHVNSPLIEKAAEAWNRRAVNVPDTNVGDTISRQTAIERLNFDAELLRRTLDDADVVDVERAKYEWGLGLIESYIASVKDLPSAQPQRMRGRWMPEFNGRFTGGAYWFSCSRCKRIVPDVRNGGWNFCPECGADMRKGQDETD